MSTERRIKKQAELARCLQRRFHGRLSIIVSPQMINHWRNGERLRTLFKDGQAVKPPLFPDKDAKGCFDTAKCVKWIEDWIVPVHAVDRVTTDFDEQQRQHKLWQMQKEKGEVEAKFKAQYDSDLVQIGDVINQAITDSGEKTFQWAAEEIVNRANLEDEKKRFILDELPKACQNAADKLRECIREALLK